MQRRREQQEEARIEYERQAEVRRIESFKDYSLVPVVTFADIAWLKGVGLVNGSKISASLTLQKVAEEAFLRGQKSGAK
jgi:hypothetical protein